MRLAALALLVSGCSPDLWSTPDQRGDREMADEHYAEAAEEYRDPMRRGVALYRDGRFEEAATEFGRVGTAEAAFDRGNALVFLGKYESAIASYEQALELRPDWKEAAENRDIAQARLEALQPPDDDAGGTGGKLEADEIVFDAPKPGGSNESKDDDALEVVDGERMGDEDIRALWLRRVDTKPRDFLRAKFSFQLARDQAAAESAEDAE